MLKELLTKRCQQERILEALCDYALYKSTFTTGQLKSKTLLTEFDEIFHVDGYSFRYIG